MSAAFSRLSRTAALLAVSGLVLTGCGTAAEIPPATGEATETNQPPVAEATTAATASGVEAGAVINGLPTKKELANDGKGEYIQTTVSPDDPARIYNPAIVQSSATDLFSEAEIREAQEMLVTFIYEEVYDSTILGNPSDQANVDRWVAKHADSFAPEHLEEVVGHIKNPTGNVHPIMLAPFRIGKYDLDYGPNAVHVAERNITFREIMGATVDGIDYLGFDATGMVRHVVHSKGSKLMEHTDTAINFTIRQDNGKWVIAGALHTFSTAAVQ